MAVRHGSATVELPSDTEILITRAFEVQRPLLWELLTQPRHLLRWWGPDFCPMVSCEVDLRAGGSWRYLCRHTDGDLLAWHGTYREVVAGERIVGTEVFEGFPEAEAVTTMSLTSEGPLTVLRTLVRHSSREHRDGHVQSGMEAGMQSTFDRLDDLVAASGAPAERFRRVAGAFADRTRAVPEDAWDNPSPCEGWTARDVVAHLTEWVPAVLARADIASPPAPDVGVDPAGAWDTVAATIQAALDDPEIAARTFDVGPPGTMAVAAAIDMIVTGDVLVHTWDVARATGLDEHLDPAIVPEMRAALAAMGDVLASSGHYGPARPVPEEASEQEALLALTGRDPAWHAPADG